MDESSFRWLKERALTFRYTSLEYAEYEDVAAYDVVTDSAPMILLKGWNPVIDMTEYHWAADDPADVLREIDIDPAASGVYITFVPPEHVPLFEQGGFSVYSHWNDYVHDDITGVKDPGGTEHMGPEDFAETAAVTQSCRGQTRGFHGETETWVHAWVRGADPGAGAAGSTDHAVLGIREGSALAGAAFVCVYGHQQKRGPILWLREIAVRPEYQGKGYGSKLLAQALWYGKSCGAVRAFLIADVCNEHAVRMYMKAGFAPRSDECQIDMVRTARLD